MADGIACAIAVAVGLTAFGCDRGRTVSISAGDARVAAAPVEGEGGGSRDPEAYDLAGDLAVRTGEARTRLGANAVTDVLDGVFLFAASRRDATYEKSLKVARQVLDAYFNGRFARRPERAVTVYVFSSSAAFHDFCKSRLADSHERDLGLYDPRRRPNRPRHPRARARASDRGERLPRRPGVARRRSRGALRATGVPPPRR